jgi:hypothetical protein
MTNVSKQKLDPKTMAELEKQFSGLFARAPKGARGDLYISLFTPAERIMFIKRLAIILLLSRKCPTYTIVKTLKVSDATVRSTLMHLEQGHYDDLIGAMHSKSFDIQGFLRVVEIILQAGLPPRGRGRWKWLYEMEDTPKLVTLLRERKRQR